MEIALTHLGTATVLLEIGSLRLLTDPALDPAGGHYRFGFGTGSTKTRSPAVPPSSLEGIDAVLLSHDQHADNLDAAGRTFLRTVPHVLTTRAAARRLGPPALGLSPGESSSLRSTEGLEVRMTATPARHGPPGSLPLVGHVIGFLLEWEGQRHGALYISGDTVRHTAMEEIGRQTRVGTALMHLGAVRFGISGPLRYTMGAADAARIAAAASSRRSRSPAYSSQVSSSPAL